MRCQHVLILGSDGPPKVARAGDLCERCQKEHAGGIRASDGARWIPEALEAMFPGEGARRSLWDLFELDPTGRYGRRSDRGEVLSRLDANTLKRLRGWLEAHWDEAAARYGPSRLRGLWTDVCLSGWLESLPPDASFIAEGDDSALPLAGRAYTSTGRSKDLTLPIKLEMLRQKPGYMSERDLARALRIPRSTLRDIQGRMREVQFSLGKKFTTDDLAYIIFGNPRGRHKPEHPS